MSWDRTKLIKLKEEIGLSDSQLGFELKVHQSSVSRWVAPSLKDYSSHEPTFKHCGFIIQFSRRGYFSIWADEEGWEEHRPLQNFSRHQDAIAWCNGNLTRELTLEEKLGI